MRGNVVKKYLSIGITYRLVLHIMVVAAVPVALIAVFAFRSGAAGITRHTHMHLASVSSMMAENVDQLLDSVERSGDAFATNLEAEGALDLLVSDPQTTPDAALSGLRSDAEAMISANPGIQRIEVLSADGQRRLFGHGIDEALAEDAPGLPYHAPSTSYRVTLAPLVHGQATRLAVMERVIGTPDGLSARLAIHISTAPVLDTLSSDAGLEGSDRVYLIDSEGYVLLSPTELAHRQGPVRAPSGLMASMASSEADRLQYNGVADVKVAGAYAPVGSTDWFIVAELPVSEAFSDIGRMRNGIAIAAALFFFLVVTAAALISRRITRPLRALSAGAVQIGQGNLSHRIEAYGDDEISKLAEAFNQMAGSLSGNQAQMVEADRAAALRILAEDNVLKLKRLTQMGLIVASATAIEDLLEECPSALRRVASADVSAVVLIEPDSPIFGLDDALGKARYPIAALADDERLEWLFSDPRLADLRKTHPEKFPASDGDPDGFSHVIGMSMLGDTGQITGAAIIANRARSQPFSEQDSELMQIIAVYISASVEKLRQAESLQRSEIRAVQALSDLERAQDQLVQSQKMESVGRLAGGIAHDFNNLLTPIMGYAQISAMTMPPEHQQVRTDLREIENLAVQGANLTRQLLAFSRRQIIRPTVVDLNTLVQDMERLLRRVIGEDIQLATHTPDRPCNVRVDPSQVDQVVMNLVVNARDAMPDGGRVVLEITNVTPDSEFYRRNPDAETGEYVRLSVADTGEGIPEEVKPHVFEPFYTTKAEGEGTGLGLATCYGIVKQSGGQIELVSELGRGTTFTIYLPRVASEETVEPSREERSSGIPRGSETILLVEDEEAVRELAARVLTDQGYTVLKASNGAEALRIAEAGSVSDIDLLLTDVIMPVMGGREIADRLTSMRPDLKVLFTSGYTDDTIARQGVLRPGTAFTHKPFSPSELARKVREVLDGSQPITTN